jgi:hypothetical protein
VSSDLSLFKAYKEVGIFYVRLFKIQIPCKLLYHYNLLIFFICVFNGTLFHMKEFDDLMLILCDV